MWGLPWLQGREGPSETSQVSDPASSNGAPTSGFGSTVAPSVTGTIRKMMDAHDMRMTNMQKWTKLNTTGLLGATQTNQ